MSNLNTLDGALTILLASRKGNVKITERTAYALAAMLQIQVYSNGNLTLPPVNTATSSLIKSLNRVRVQNAFVVHGIDSTEWSKLQLVLGTLNAGDKFSVTEVD